MFSFMANDGSDMCKALVYTICFHWWRVIRKLNGFVLKMRIILISITSVPYNIVYTNLAAIPIENSINQKNIIRSEFILAIKVTYAVVTIF